LGSGHGREFVTNGGRAVPQKKSIALILKTQDYGEADRLVVFLSPGEGRVTALAKHARKSKRRFMNCLEPFSLVQFIYTEKPQQDLARLESGELVESFPELRRDLVSLGAAACLAEVAGELVGAIDNVAELFEAVKNALRQLAGGLPTRSLMLSYLIRLLALAGFGPRWQACQICGKQTDGIVWFSLKRGGIICQACLGQGQEERLYPLHPGTRKLIVAAHGLPLEHLGRLRFPELAQKETLVMLQGFMRFILGKELKTLNFINKIKFIRE
jgi:DNA repair protein RecO (recombination protein O)